MIVDRDEARLWADHHHEFSRWANGVARGIGQAFRVLARVQYDQPWNRADRCQPRH